MSNTLIIKTQTTGQTLESSNQTRSGLSLILGYKVLLSCVWRHQRGHVTSCSVSAATA